MLFFEEIDKSSVPSHVAVIMDGNGRWAKQKGLVRTQGHKRGLEVAKEIVKAASKIGIKYLTLYTFSTENWKRTQEEVGFLMNLIRVHLKAEFDFYKQNHIRIKHIGDIKGLPEDIQIEINNAVNETSCYNGLTVVLAINYGGRDELKRSIVSMNEKGLDFSTLDESVISKNLDEADLPDVDLLIRTGGEKRISNFLLWQVAYAELYFTDTLWPDYTEEEFYQGILDFQKRNRRFGGV